MPDSPKTGWFYPPTVLQVNTFDVPVWREEVFGPVAVMTRFNTTEQAISLANDTRYGLGASVWTSSTERANRFQNDIDAGCVFVNQIVKSQPDLPFGGIKSSGVGKELGLEGLLSFVNTKIVC